MRSTLAVILTFAALVSGEALFGVQNYRAAFRDGYEAFEKGNWSEEEQNIIFENLKVIEPLSASDVVLNGIWNYTLNNDNLTITYPSTGDVFQLSKKPTNKTI